MRNGSAQMTPVASSRSPRAFTGGARDLAGIASVLWAITNFLSAATELCDYTRDPSLGGKAPSFGMTHFMGRTSADYPTLCRITTIGDSPLIQLDVHLSSRFIQEDL